MVNNEIPLRINTLLLHSIVCVTMHYKPTPFYRNILLTRKNIVKLNDLGLAKYVKCEKLQKRKERKALGCGLISLSLKYS